MKQLPHFVSSREHIFPYFNILEIGMYLKIDGMSYFNRQHFFFFFLVVHPIKLHLLTEDILDSMEYGPRYLEQMSFHYTG